MCKLLRTRVAAVEKKQQQQQEEEGGREGGRLPVPTVALSQITRNARRTKAANLFWEVLQLKTWDFIECAQETAYGEVVIRPAARFHEAIPGEV
jgi:chromatin segregation and condensation protein Rec8/ScpA/Scc1 (kleisin family)